MRQQGCAWLVLQLAISCRARHSDRRNVTPLCQASYMDLGPVIRIIENVPSALPAERQPATPAPKEPAPSRLKEPIPA
ncbi:MAG TPA: hypothetical protein VJ755_13535 [Gemmatimonadales bacterium]|nr:hypothetical protein [Gemmatimonadales bacterium]